MHEDLVIRPSSVLAVKAAANTFLFGGKAALRNMLEKQHNEAPQSLQIYAVDTNGQELLGRSISSDTLQRINDSG